MPRMSESPENKQRKGKGTLKPSTGGPSIWLQLAMAFAVFLVLSTGYSFIREYIVTERESVPISQIAADIAAGEVISIVVEGDSLTATYTDDTEKTSRKETETSLTETFANFDVPKERIDAVKIEI